MYSHDEIDKKNEYYIKQVFLFLFPQTGDAHEEQNLVVDKKDKDLSGYERNLYLYHVSLCTIVLTFLCALYHMFHICNHLKSWQFFLGHYQ